MTNTVALADDLAAIAEQLLRARIQGASERSLARHFGITVADVRAAVNSLIPTLDADARRRELALELLRLDELVAVFHQKARQGDPVSATVCVRLSERRGALLGHDVAPRHDVVLSVEPAPRPTSTMEIRRAIQRVVSERPAVTQSAPVLNGEVLPPDGAVPH